MDESSGDWHRVARRSEMSDPDSYGFNVPTKGGGMPLFGFLVQRNGELFAYENVCPHAGRMLNHGPHRFLTEDRSMIVCAAHGAMFDIGSGECAVGPCMGESLRPMPWREIDDTIEVDLSGVAWL